MKCLLKLIQLIFWWSKILLFYCIMIPATALAAFIASLWIFKIPFQIRYNGVKYWARFFLFSAKYLFGLNFNIHYEIPLPKTPCIFFCNHQSLWETIFTTAYLPTQSWIIKKELVWLPFFGWGIACLNPIVIDRKKSSSVKQILEQGKKLLLEQKRCIVLYPQGTRVPYGQQGHYRRSAARLSLHTQIPIVPMAHNAGKFWPKGFFPKAKGTIEVFLGKPILPASKTIEALNEQAIEWIETRLSIPKAF